MTILSQGYEVHVEYNIPATMRDGIVLRANIYRPLAEGRWPVVLMRIPYGKNLPLASATFDPAQMAQNGYTVVIQDTRGRYASEGEWQPFVNEWLDGVDTINWAAELPYSDGSVAMFGGSYSGFTQWAPAVLQPSPLKAIIPMIAPNDPLNGAHYRGGAFELGKTANWSLQSVGVEVMKRRLRNVNLRQRVQVMRELMQEINALGTQGYWSLPLKEFAPLKRAGVAPDFFEELEYPMDRASMDAMVMIGKHEKVKVPSLNITGWYDIYSQSTIDNFKIMREHGCTEQARQSKLFIAPWSHMNRSNLIGEINFGLASNSASIDLTSTLDGIHRRWFDYWLKGIDNGVAQEAPIKLFVMGANVWRDEYEWPLERAVNTRYYLHSSGHANTLQGDGVLNTLSPQEEPVDRYDYDPARPVMTRGGAILLTPEFPAGPYDQRSLEQREDVLVYTTAPLEEDTEVTGQIKVSLWTISSALDTDFVARLVDVYPDGYAQNLTDGIIRARYRHFAQGEAPSLIEAGKAYEYEIDLWSTSNVFLKGHCIRLDVTSSSFPRWDRNPNTGHDFCVDDELQIAQQAILHDSEHPSCVVLPIVPANL